MEGLCSTFWKANDKKCESCHEMLQASHWRGEAFAVVFGRGLTKSVRAVMKCNSSSVLLVVLVLVVLVLEVPTRGGWPLQYFLEDA